MIALYEEMCGLPFRESPTGQLHVLFVSSEQQKATLLSRRLWELFGFQVPTLPQGTQYTCNYVVLLLLLLMIMYIILTVELCRLCRFNNADINKDRERTRFFSLQCTASY